MGDDIEIRILFFGKARELVRKPFANIKVPASCSALELFETVSNRIPELDNIQNCYILALNQVLYVVFGLCSNLNFLIYGKSVLE